MYEMVCLTWWKIFSIFVTFDRWIASKASNAMTHRCVIYDTTFSKTTANAIDGTSLHTLIIYAGFVI